LFCSQNKAFFTIFAALPNLCRNALAGKQSYICLI